MHPEVTYTRYAISSKKQTGDINTFAQFEEGNLLTETQKAVTNPIANNLL